jgi:hypothetical protein
LVIGCYRLLAAFLAALVGSAQLAAAQVSPKLSLTITAPAVTVFKHATQACDDIDIPDAPARAIRLADGSVRLFAPHYRDRTLVGSDLLSLKPDCHIVYQGAENADPAQFDDRLWIASVWTPDGNSVYALVHGEYQGNMHPGQCPSGRYIECWYNAITLAHSDDGGRAFTRSPDNKGLVAAIPYRYDIQAHRNIGYFNPTNIVSDGEYFYAMVHAAAYGLQQHGDCLLRTRDLSDPASWRGWDGEEFTVSFVDPYRSMDPSGQHVCRPVASLGYGPLSLVRHAPTGQYLALFVAENDTRTAAPAYAVYVAASPDLIHWSDKSKIMPITLPNEAKCGDPLPLAYPSLLDPQSSSRNFETVGDQALLFLTRFNLDHCHTSLDRDLIRYAVAITVPAPH